MSVDTEARIKRVFMIQSEAERDFQVLVPRRRLVVPADGCSLKRVITLFNHPPLESECLLFLHLNKQQLKA